VILAGQVIFGASQSFTVTVKLQAELLFDESVAVQDTSVAPFGNSVPDCGVQTTLADPLALTSR
jgi:hypothetical protein